MNNQIAGRLSEVLEYLSKHQGIKQKYIADKIGVNENTIGKWKKGISYPCADDLQNLSIHFGVNASYIVAGQKPMLHLHATILREPEPFYGLKQVQEVNDNLTQQLTDKEKIIQLMEQELSILRTGNKRKDKKT